MPHQARYDGFPVFANRITEPQAAPKQLLLSTQEVEREKGSAMTTKSPTSRTRTIEIACACTLIALAGIAGCSRSDDAQAAVKEASRSFSSVAAGDSTASETFSQKAYTQTEQLVSEYAGSEDGYAEAAAVTLSLAKLGQASLASSKASQAEIAALHKARIIRGMINEWLTMTAIAQGAGQFDPSAELAEINKLISIRKDDIKQYQAQRKQVEARIAELDAQIAELRTKSVAERNQSGALELQMPRVSAAEAAQIVVRVREHTLRADNYELEAIRIEGVVGQLRPGAREISLNVEKATSQIALLEDARNELAEREASSKADAQLANDAASAATERLEKAVADYAQFRDTQVNDANEKAISLTRASISALRDANKTIKQVASLTKASAQQTLAECYARQAAGYAEAAILYHALEEAGIPGNWTAKAQEARDEQARAKEAANDAFQGAASALRSARVRGDEGEKLEATAARLDLLGGLEPEPEYDDMNDMNDMNNMSDMDHDMDMSDEPNEEDDG